MEVTNRIAYDIDKSSERMDEILNANSGSYSDKENSVPSRDSLTYTNGFYVNVASLFIDMIGSSDMTDEHKRPTLAKIYRCFISECTAIMNSVFICKEININGDCVWAVFETPYKSNIDTVFSVAGRLNSLIKILNYKLRNKNYSEISVGIGIDDGRVLMVKAGYSGSGLNDVIWMGDVVNSACHIANKAGRGWHDPIMVSSFIYENLSEYNQGLLQRKIIDSSIYYTGNIIALNMEEWYNENCKILIK